MFRLHYYISDVLVFSYVPATIWPEETVTEISNLHIFCSWSMNDWMQKNCVHCEFLGRCLWGRQPGPQACAASMTNGGRLQASITGGSNEPVTSACSSLWCPAAGKYLFKQRNVSYPQHCHHRNRNAVLCRSFLMIIMIGIRVQRRWNLVMFTESPSLWSAPGLPSLSPLTHRQLNHHRLHRHHHQH